MNFFVDHNNNIMWAAGSVGISIIALIVSVFSIFNSNKQSKKNRAAQLLLKHRIEELSEIKKHVLKIIKELDSLNVGSTNKKTVAKKLEDVETELQQITSSLNIENLHAGDFSVAISTLVLVLFSSRQKQLSDKEIRELIAETRITLDFAFRNYENNEKKEVNVLL